MTADRAARLVARWVRLYTRGLPGPAAARRIEELDADLHDHVAHERARGTTERSIALALVARMVRGLPADAAWRRRTIARTSTQKEPNMLKPLHRSLARVALATALVLLVPLIAMQLSGEVSWSVADFVGAAVLLAGTGLLLEVAFRNPRNVLLRVAAVAIAVAAIAFGQADDAPGLVGFGCLVILGTAALTFRTAQRSE